MVGIIVNFLSKIRPAKLLDENGKRSEKNFQSKKCL